MADVFISYSSLDRPAAEVMAQAIEARGASVWWDRKIDAGASFDRIIERELESARCVIVLWSGHSVESDWVRSEAAAAAERGVLMPVSIEAVRLPLEFRRKQTLDLSGWDRTSADPTLAKVLDPLAERLGGSSGIAVDPSSLRQTRRPFFQGTWARMTFIGAAFAAVAALAIVSYMKLKPADSTDYTLVCRGGGPFGIESRGLFAGRIAFEKSRGSAASLQPGQCAWTDRAVNDMEPAQMCYSSALTSTITRRFAAPELLRQQAHFDVEDACLRVTKLL